MPKAYWPMQAKGLRPGLLWQAIGPTGLRPGPAKAGVSQQAGISGHDNETLAQLNVKP